MLSLCDVTFVFAKLKVDVLIEFGLALLTLRQEVETDAAYVLLGAEVLGTVHLVAFYLKFHQPPGVEAHLVTVAQVAVDDGREAHHDAEHIAFGET